MLVINQRYGSIKWIDAYPLRYVYALLGAESKIHKDSRAIQLGSIMTSKPGWHNHKSCDHVQVAAEVDFDMPAGPDETLGLLYADGRYVIDEGDYERIIHLRDFSPGTSSVDNLDYAVRGRVSNLNDGQKMFAQLQCRHQQFDSRRHFWYPEVLQVGFLYAKGSGSSYDYKMYYITLKTWDSTMAAVRKTSLQELTQWNMSIDMLLTTYGSKSYDEYALLWFNQEYANVVHSMRYAGHHCSFSKYSLERQYRSIPLSDEYIRRYMEKWIFPYFGTYPTPSISDWGDLCHDAIQKCNLDVNAWTLQSDISEVGSEIVSYLRALRKPSLKNISGAYLNTRYGTRLTVSDIEAYGTRLQSLISDYNHVYQGYDVYASRRFLSASCSNGWSGYDSVACYASVKDSMLDIVVHSLQETGIGRLSNAWDIIPFTFVVDWFFDVGDIFEQLDYRWNASTLAVHDVIRTVKRVKSIPIDNFLGSGKRVTVTMSVYSRSCGNKLSFPSLGIASTDAYQNHVLDLSMIGLHLLG